jgi:hypothetical protein
VIEKLRFLTMKGVFFGSIAGGGAMGSLENKVAR